MSSIWADALVPGVDDYDAVGEPDKIETVEVPLEKRPIER